MRGPASLSCVCVCVCVCVSLSLSLFHITYVYKCSSREVYDLSLSLPLSRAQALAHACKSRTSMTSQQGKADLQNPSHNCRQRFVRVKKRREAGLPRTRLGVETKPTHQSDQVEPGLFEADLLSSLTVSPTMQSEDISRSHELVAITSTHPESTEQNCNGDISTPADTRQRWLRSWVQSYHRVLKALGRWKETKRIEEVRRRAPLVIHLGHKSVDNYVANEGRLKCLCHYYTYITGNDSSLVDEWRSFSDKVSA
ncbi:hypothetical protein O6H91_05G114300 [Diphasiastrum complanatum]|uniref:Uncharacterized protein n=1 Tax=Diphasiastrum complanatum TaxID=34168 RepID=A0ACC2DSQ2_DIPCM|nr:hypothetical protein O6H91_05G114300 [Diphasiastrum complanatum]